MFDCVRRPCRYFEAYSSIGLTNEMYSRQVQNAGCRLEFCRLPRILQVDDARLPGILQVDDANLKLHHFKVF
jgi:hypothetical protein